MLQTHHVDLESPGLSRLGAFASGRLDADPSILGAMHEVGLAAEIYRIARDAAEARGGGRLEAVTVVVGDLAAVEPDLLDFAWSAVIDGGPDEGAQLVIDWRRARQHCAFCGDVAERAAGTWLRLCPGCGEPLAVIGGDELEVRRVEFLEKTA
jgi:hydrogenase nickel incorporation protein HypA/HybF